MPLQVLSLSQAVRKSQAVTPSAMAIIGGNAVGIPIVLLHEGRLAVPCPPLAHPVHVLHSCLAQEKASS